MTKKRILTLLLAILMLPPLTSCSETAEQSGETTPSASEVTPTEVTETVAEEETRPQANIPEKDWDGSEWMAMGQTDTTYSQFSNHDIDADEINGEALNDAIYNRNLTIEERYNLVISQDISSYRTFDVLPALIMAGENLYDAVFCIINNVGASLATKGYLHDITALPYVDYNADWWNKEVNEQLSIANKLYFTTSDFALSDKQRVNVLFYNKALHEDLQLPDPVEMVREGTWTIDVMTEWVSQTGRDLDGDGQMTDQDMYGLGMDSYNAFKGFTIGGGARIIGKDADDIPYLTMNDERMHSAVEKVLELTCDTNYALFCNDFNGKVSYDFWSVSSTIFKAGNMLFLNGFTHSLSAMSDSEIDYNVIPFPKLNEEQENYYTMVDMFSMTFGIPSSCTEEDVDFSAFVLEALSWESTETTLYTYYDINCKRKYTYDETGAEMLDLIFSGLVYDLSLIYSWGGVSDILTVTIPTAKSNTFASEYTKKEKAANKLIDRTVSGFLE